MVEHSPNKAGDRNFDDLAQRFAHRVYGGLKGEIRLAVLWRDIEQCIQPLERQGKTLSVLDVGGGLGQLAIRLAMRGHNVVFNDISATMMQHAREQAMHAGVEGDIEWHLGSYQQLLPDLGHRFDLILCHAMLEWLAQPQALVPLLAPQLADEAHLSLCFYNPAAKVYRNLIRGNFDWLKAQISYQSDAGSLTPNNPSSIEQVRQWLTAARLSTVCESGIRVFHDYVVDKRGGHQSASDVLAMELEHSRQQPYKELGRYFHILSRPNIDISDDISNNTNK